jgi:hypothetical protein
VERFAVSTAEINIAKAKPARRASLGGHAARAALSGCGRSWFFWMWVVMVGLFGAATVSSHQPVARWVWPILSFYAGSFLPLMLVEHIASHRADLVPRFRQVHIVAQVLCSLGIFGLLTAWLAWWSQISLWPVTGVAVFALALGHWNLRGGWAAIGTNLIIPVALCFVGIVPLVFYPANVNQLFRRLEYIETVTANVKLGLLGALLLFLNIDWLWRLDEDNPAYERCRRIAAAAHFTVRSPRRQSWMQPGIVDGVGSLRLSRWLMPVVRLQDWLLETSLSCAGRSGGWKLLHWEVAWPGFLLTVTGYWTAVLAIELTLWTRHGLRGSEFGLALLVVFGFLAQLIIFVRIEQRPLLIVESIRPLNRERLLRRWGTGVLLPLLGAVIVGIVISLLAFLTWPVGELPARRLSPSFALAWCGLWIASLFAQTALLLLLRTFGSAVLDVIGFLVGTGFYGIGVMLPFAMGTTLTPGPWPTLVAASVVVAAGFAMLWFAYRRWLVTDLD